MARPFADRDQHGPVEHGPIAKASEDLLAALKNAGVLEDSAEEPDAMLWLMGRVAWEAHMLEQRHPPQPLTRRHIDNLLQDGDVPIPVGAADTIRIGLILALQADLHSANHTILFGHLSFREFLVGRHWALILRRLVRGTGRRERLLAPLLGGRLLGTEGKSFAFLMTFINATAAQPRPTSPLTWDDRDREALVRLMQEIFEDERQEFGERARTNSRVDPRLRHDRRAELREAALAIGSKTKGSTGLRASDPLTLRSMLAWFWLQDEPARIIAPRAHFSGADLRGADLRGADLGWADLRGADLRGADLGGANLHGADLRGADLGRADLSEADLSEADLSEADLSEADLSEANFCRADLLGADLAGANLGGANLNEANLGGANLNEADLRGAVLIAADFRGADLLGADLVGADLGGAHLSGTNLRGADLSETNVGGADLGGADLHEANLRDADLGGADLGGADLGGANLGGANLDDSMLIGVISDEATLWPEGFDRLPVVETIVSTELEAE